MFILRFLTSSLLLPLVLWLILFANNLIFCGVTGVIILIAGIEWLRLFKFHHEPIRFGLGVVVYFTILYTLGIQLLNFKQHTSVNLTFNLDPVTNIFRLPGIFLSSMIFWVMAAISIVLYTYKTAQFNRLIKLWPNTVQIIAYLASIWHLIPAWIAINYFKLEDPGALALIIIMVISADIGGYLFGKLFGRNKLSIVSPNKTWEGVVGGLIISIGSVLGIIFIAANKVFNLLGYSLIKLILIILLGNILAIIGDLFESLIKRLVGAKDSGRILPGHGGILDRIDSLCAVLPIFAFLVILISYLS